MTDRSIWVALALVAAAGCAPKSLATPAADPVTTPVQETEAGGTCRIAKMDSCTAELEAVARCFHACVTAAQAEPGEAPLAAFIAEHGSGEDCALLGMKGPCGTLELSAGGEVVHAHEMASHDNYDDKDVMHIAYTFSSASCPGTAGSTIELHVGQ